MYQGICIANCESKASHPQRIPLKDIGVERMNSHMDSSTMSEQKWTQKFLYI
jgi:hypothetical protein